MEYTNASSPTDTSHVVAFPPVVAVLGHVDHGKTTLLDTLRQTSIAEREKGGITQKIGASSISFMHDNLERKITFIDTPGHEAFSKMRGRGAQAADIALLIVSAADGVKPQTRESIAALQESKTPFIVVLTKADLPTKNSEKVKQELLRENVILEGYGGEIPVIEVSAKTQKNIQELLDLILLFFDMHKSSTYAQEISNSAPLQAIVIESRLDNRIGPKATVIIKNGTLSVREEIRIEGKVVKVRALLNEFSQPMPSATVGDAVEVLGFTAVPSVGSILRDVASKEEISPVSQKPLERELVYRKPKEKEGLSVILIADTQGSLEAVVNALPEGIVVVSKKTGVATEADVLLAKSTGSFVISFNTKIKPDLERFAYSEKVLVRNYDIIYELIDELEDALEGKLLSQMEKIFGEAKVLAKFPFEKTFAFGVKVTEGRLAQRDRLRIVRGEEVIGETVIMSLRVGKNSTSKVEKGNECGIVLSPELDIQLGDMILSHS